MIEFQRIFRLIYAQNQLGPIIEGRFILKNPNAVISMEEYLAPALTDPEHPDPKTQLDFSSGKQVVIVGDVVEVASKIKKWEDNELLGINGKEYI
jgi:uncharacterized protein YlzI (FlbEa/FlbD family)